jgi:hypothetical protein
MCGGEIIVIIAHNSENSLLKKVLHITDPALNYELLSQYSLLFMIGEQFLGCVLFHSGDKTVSFHSFLEAGGTRLTVEEVAGFLEENSWLKGPFQKVDAVSYTTRQTLVPVDLFDDDNPSYFADLQYGIQKNELILPRTIHTIGGVSLTSVPQDIFSLVNERYANTRWSHWHEHIVSAVAQDDAKIHLSFFLNTFSMAVEKNGQWQLVQTYNYLTPEDVLYKVLRCFEEFRIDAAVCPVSIDGLVDPDSAMVQLLSQYIPHLVWLDQLKFEYPQAAEATPAHTFALTDRILTCVS